MVKEGMKNIYICFPEGKHKVLTMSFDDGRVEDRQLVDMFNRYGIRGTFHVNSGIAAETRVPVSEYRELYRGHEVSCPSPAPIRQLPDAPWSRWLSRSWRIAEAWRPRWDIR